MGAVSLRAIAATLVAAAGPALAHAPDAVVPAPDLWRWSLEPWLLWLLGLAALLYAVGVARLWRRAGFGRGVGGWQAGAFAAGWSMLLVALVSPLDALGTRLFSAHMVQHELLMVAAAPLLVLARPLGAWTWALAPRHRHWVGRATHWPWLAAAWTALTRAPAAWALHALALWLWHVPPLFDAALHSEGLHILQHASFLATALLFWWTVLGGDPRSRGHGGLALLSLFTTMVHTGALGALLALAPTPWYAVYVASAPALGFNPLEDQQLGGLIMWVPGGIAYLLAGLALTARLLTPAMGPASAARPAQPR
jgi:putative membrane protein